MKTLIFLQVIHVFSIFVNTLRAGVRYIRTSISA